jgi:hypothetical protein
VLERGVLGVGGMPYVLLLPRSADFDQFFTLLKSAYPDQRDVHAAHRADPVLWDPGETSGWAWAMNKRAGARCAGEARAAAGGDRRRAGDDAGGAHHGAGLRREDGGRADAAGVRGRGGEAGGFQGSALVEWLYTDVPDEPVENLPPQKSSDTHECPRREPAAQEQLRDFLVDGVVNQYCEGPCVGLRADTCG